MGDGSGGRRLPRALPPGGTIGICAPAGPVHPERLAMGLQALWEAGFRLVAGRGLLGRRGYLAGGDADRAADLQALLDDPGVDAVVAARGGYGLMRVLPRLDLSALARRPKPVVGFSDLTALHLALGRLGLVSFHGPMVEASTETGFGAENLDWLVRSLTRPQPLGTLPADGARTLAPGRARGVLVGGNLTLLAASLGTPWELRAEGAILLLEDVDEPPYRLDRCLAQLEAAGALRGVAGVACGEFARCPGADEWLAERLPALGVPAVAGLPFGHGRRRLTLPLGVLAELDAGCGGLRVLEGAVADG